MDAFASFFARHLDVVFFFYGLAFFSMGLAILLETGRSSEFRLARSMGALAGFGILHGCHEWIEMFERLGKFGALSPEQLFFVSGVRIGVLVLSFLMLVTFGIRLLYSNRRISTGADRPVALIAVVLLTTVWFVSVLLTRLVYDPPPTGLVGAADVLARYIAGIPGALLAAWAILLEQRAFRARAMPQFGRALVWAAAAMVLYGVVGQLFIAPSFIFPANVINASLFLQLFGFPVQLFRAILSIIMAIFVIRALRVFELERQQNLAAANQARLAAQQAALETEQRAKADVEELNRELQLAVQDLTVLFELSRTLTSSLDRETVLHNALGHILDSLPRLEGGLVMLRPRTGGPLAIVAISGYGSGSADLVPAECTVNRARILGEYVAETGQVALCKESEIVPLGAYDEVNLAQGREEIIPGAFTAGVPLLLHELVSGSLVLSANPGTHAITGRDLFLISTVAGQLGIALENAYLYDEVQTRDALRGQLLHEVVSAQERERQRVARELHDGTGQTLTALGLVLAAAAEHLHTRPELAASQLAELKNLTGHALQEVHDVIADLRPSVLDNLGLVPALRGQVQAFEQRTGVHATLSIKGSRRRLPTDMELVIFRIAQEALTNAAKHAAASHVKVMLAFEDQALQLTVTDDGRGFAPAQAQADGGKRRRNWGLLGMQERAALVGGEFQLESTPGSGTVIRVTIPQRVEEMPYVEDPVAAG